MTEEKYPDGGKAVIEAGSIVIRVPIEALQLIVDGAWRLQFLQKKLIVRDPNEFAKAIVDALNHEAEDGSTAVHDMFDEAIVEAIDQGAFGIEDAP